MDRIKENKNKKEKIIMSYKDFQPANHPPFPEAIDWCITYTYNATDTEKPRVLMIGDSICNAYHSKVLNFLKDKINVSYWATAKCVTNKSYFRQLDLILSDYHYDIITFNNALHSLTADPAEWKYAYQQAVHFIRHKYPDAILMLVTGTPVAQDDEMEALQVLNQIIRDYAAQESLPLIDLFAETEALPKENRWTDGVHFQQHVIEKQAAFMAERIQTAYAGKKAL